MIAAERSEESVELLLQREDIQINLQNKVSKLRRRQRGAHCEKS